MAGAHDARRPRSCAQATHDTSLIIDYATCHAGRRLLSPLHLSASRPIDRCAGMMREERFSARYFLSCRFVLTPSRMRALILCSKTIRPRHELATFARPPPPSGVIERGGARPQPVGLPEAPGRPISAQSAREATCFCKKKHDVISDSAKVQRAARCKTNFGTLLMPHAGGAVGAQALLRWAITSTTSPAGRADGTINECRRFSRTIDASSRRRRGPRSWPPEFRDATMPRRR